MELFYEIGDTRFSPVELPLPDITEGGFNDLADILDADEGIRIALERSGTTREYALTINVDDVSDSKRSVLIQRMPELLSTIRHYQAEVIDWVKNGSYALLSSPIDEKEVLNFIAKETDKID